MGPRPHPLTWSDGAPDPIQVTWSDGTRSHAIDVVGWALPSRSMGELETAAGSPSSGVLGSCRDNVAFFRRSLDEDLGIRRDGYGGGGRGGVREQRRRLGDRRRDD